MQAARGPFFRGRAPGAATPFPQESGNKTLAASEHPENPVAWLAGDVMAGDWIKMRTDLHSLPQFSRLRDELRVSSAELLMLLYRLAGWFEKHGDYGQIKADDAVAIDSFLGKKGITQLLKNCGWLKGRGCMVHLSGFYAPSMTRKSIGVKTRADVLASGQCSSCGSSDDLVVDHVIPIVRGGSSERNNLQCLCAACNRAKGRMTMDEFMAERQGS